MVISLKLVVDKQRNKVAYAECDGDFVDILFSFMTLPLGTIVRLLDKNSGLGLLDNLYQSIDNLETMYFQTESCKSMLLQPRSTAERRCEDLVINIDDLEPKRLFRCENWYCCARKHRHYSSVVGVKCPCGLTMDKSNLEWPKKENDNGDGVFVKCSTRFIVSDNLHVLVSSVASSVSCLKGLGIMDISMLEEIETQVDKSQVAYLLKRSFHSKTPLSDVFLNHSTDVNTVKTEPFSTSVKIKCEYEVPMKENLPNADQSCVIKAKIFLCKSSEKAILESENNFADLVFSFLTFPLGCALSLLGKRFSSLSYGCIHYIYNSIADLKDDKLEALSAASKNMLLNPKVPPYFSCSNQTLKVDEMESSGISISSCKTCMGDCLHYLPKVFLTELNPKIAEASSEHGGGFARSPSRFLIDSGMKVKPKPTIFQMLKDLGVSSLDSIREKEVNIGEAEALNLLLACLTSTTVGDKFLLFNLLNL